MAFLELTGIRKEFGATVAVRDFSMSIQQGEFISLLGPSGCGKTTVLRMIAGFEHPTRGAIVIDGRDVTGVSANKRNIGMVFQQYALFPNMTVAENIQFGLKVRRADAALRKQRVAEMLEIIHMRDFGARFPHQLSGGQQQRVALARALAIQPTLLLLDEPLSALDAKIRVTLRQEIRSIQRQLGITTIFVTHDQEEALSISDRIVVMNAGIAEQIGTPLEIYNSPQTQFVASFIGTLNVLHGHVIDRASGRIRIDGQEVTTGMLISDGKETVSIALRPETIRIGYTNGHSSALSATVEDVYFMGSVVRVRTRLAEQHVNVDTFNSAGMSIPKVGEQVQLAFPAEAARVLTDTASADAGPRH
ncbi:MAG: ABC transporter ATP-binding protein [Candidatus Flexifilum sp.]|jgi:putative spermidine/putrescine transport system ATP-binding protein